MVVDETNGIILFEASGESYSPPPGTRGIPVEHVVLEGSGSASTLEDASGHTLCVLATEGFYLPINRWVNGLVAQTVGSSASIRVFLKRAAQ